MFFRSLPIHGIAPSVSWRGQQALNSLSWLSGERVQLHFGAHKAEKPTVPIQVTLPHQEQPEIHPDHFPMVFQPIRIRTKPEEPLDPKRIIRLFMPDDFAFEEWCQDRYNYILCKTGGQWVRVPHGTMCLAVTMAHLLKRLKAMDTAAKPLEVQLIPVAELFGGDGEVFQKIYDSINQLETEQVPQALGPVGINYSSSYDHDFQNPDPLLKRAFEKPGKVPLQPNELPLFRENVIKKLLRIYRNLARLSKQNDKQWRLAINLKSIFSFLIKFEELPPSVRFLTLSAGPTFNMLSLLPHNKIKLIDAYSKASRTRKEADIPIPDRPLVQDVALGEYRFSLSKIDREARKVIFNVDGQAIELPLHLIPKPIKRYMLEDYEDPKHPKYKLCKGNAETSFAAPVKLVDLLLAELDKPTP